ncbi:glycosyltransferase [Marinobacter salsuginis]|jgi:glycosyltransferase involved in cell wall biosynthesis|uniref:glycosyltransferase n=1 Tax=Marinobacter salsuginis TaxID=418719 RepID=UPI00273F77EB|nr:glycosyltransferase [Marinobacter salsuginis]
MENRPDISVIVISFNQERYIEKALRSIISQQTNFAFEVVLSDDGSSDETPNIARSVAALSSVPVIVLDNNNVGVMRNFFRAWENCSGRYLAFLEGDDFWRDIGKLEKQCRFLEDHPHYSMCFHEYVYANEQGEIAVNSKKRYRDFSQKDLIDGKFAHLNTILCRNIIGDIRPEAERVIQGDQFILSRLGVEGPGKYISGICPSAYRIHDKGAWSTLAESEKYSRVMETFFWISEYYRRVELESLANVYDHKICQLILSRSAVSGSVKTGVLSLFPKLIKILRELRRSVRKRIYIFREKV